MNALVLIFWLLFLLSAALVFYAYLGYPLVIGGLNRIFRRRAPKPLSEEQLPTLSILIVGYNEEARVMGRLENLFALDYPAEKLEIVIACDGCSDQTAERARVAALKAGRNVVVQECRERRGKSETLNQVIPTLQGEFVLLGDMRQDWAADVARKLLAHFRDPLLGAVSGELVFRDPTGQGLKGLDFYWRLEAWLRAREGETLSVPGCSGCLYALRKSFFRPIPAEALTDDVSIPLKIAEQGLRIGFEPTAQAYDDLTLTPEREWRRKMRTLAGVWQVALFPRRFGNPYRRGWMAFAFISHKLSRLLAPFFLAAMLLLLLPLAAVEHPGQDWAGWLLAGAGIFLLAGFLGFFLKSRGGRVPLWLKPLNILGGFGVMNWGAAAALWFLFQRRGEKSGAWAVQREPAAESGQNGTR